VNFARAAREVGTSVAIPIVALTLALVTAGAFLLLADADPIAAYDSMFIAAFADPFSVSNTVVKTMPRLFAALGIALALRAGLWNIGAEGQLYVGAIAATGVALFGPDLGFVTVVAALLAGMAAGAAWGAVPGVLRAGRGISEVITSLMLVYVAIQLTNYLVEGPWLVSGSTFPASGVIPSDERLPNIWPSTLLNAGAIVAALAVVVAWFLVSRTTFGLHLRAVGGGERAARFLGVSVKTVVIVAMAVSGAFAGLGGAVEVLGVRGRLIEGFSPGYGFEAIAIALIGRLHPVGIVVAALLFGALDAGGTGLQVEAQGVPAAIVQITAGLAVVYVLIGFGLRNLLLRRRRTRLALKTHRRDQEPDADSIAIAKDTVVTR
jgi:general nucleoside transport system permease protein